MFNTLKEKIIDIVGVSNYRKAKLLPLDSVQNQKVLTILGNSKIYKYKVDSINNDNTYKVEIIMQHNEVIGSNCTCPMCDETGSCKHIALVLIKYGSEIFPNLLNEEIKVENELETSQKIINDLYNLNGNYDHKTVLNLEIELRQVSGYGRGGVYVYLKVGENKLYSLNNKLSLFLNTYNGFYESYEFGKQFTYNPSIQKFNEVDSKIIDYIDSIYDNEHNYYESAPLLKGKQILDFLNLLENKEFNVYPYYHFNGFIKQNPFEFKITKHDDLYNLTYDADYKYLFVNNFIIKDNLLYQIDKELANVLTIMNKYKTNSLTFEKKDLSKLVMGMGNKVLEEKTSYDEGIKDDFVIIKPKTELYFDFLDNVICNIKFNYKGTELYYGSDNNSVLRNYEYENSVVSDVISHNFNYVDNKFVLNDLDDFDIFLDKTLPELKQKYDIYTSEKLDNTKIIEKTHIVSHFSIGTDNIFKYDFNLDGIDTSEISHIFDSLNNKKKYYKLKNGNVINLQNENLKEFNNLTNDLNINPNNIENNHEYTIPKYRAIYLDSLKYNMVKTNNLFDEFINKFKKYKNISLDINDDILREYQVVGVKWLYNIYKCGFGAILADEMGLGKSIQIIYFIKQLIKENSEYKFLIVAPTSLIYNWENEFNKFGSDLKYKVIAGTKKIRNEIFDSISNTNIIITTYGLLREDFDIYKDYHFEVMIIDEAQNIKNPKALITKTVKNINSSIKFALTGTPLENSVTELWSIFDYIMPGYLNSLTYFQAKYNIKEMDDEALDILKSLDKQITPFILRRKKSDVLKDLPDKIDNNIYLDLYPEQKKVYVEQLKKTKEEMDEIISSEGFLKARFKILQLLTRLRQICIDPKLIFDEYKGEAIKIDTITSLVKDIVKNNHKILIFTSYKKALEIVMKSFEKENITYYIIDGSVSSKKRAELVDAFNNDNTNVFLIMLKAGGTGLNLTSADVVIHLDLWWNPQVENQATDRAHRIGQKKTVEVIRLICKGTIEERILELQNKKRLLSDALIEGDVRDQNMISNLDEKEIRNLLSFSDED